MDATKLLISERRNLRNTATKIHNQISEFGNFSTAKMKALVGKLEETRERLKHIDKILVPAALEKEAAGARSEEQIQTTLEHEY